VSLADRSASESQYSSVVFFGTISVRVVKYSKQFLCGKKKVVPKSEAILNVGYVRDGEI
jgi:hypothetical protein